MLDPEAPVAIPPEPGTEPDPATGCGSAPPMTIRDNVMTGEHRISIEWDPRV